MNDPLDSRLRQLVTQLTESIPPAPTSLDVGQGRAVDLRQPVRRVWPLAAAAAVVVIAIGVAVAFSRSSDRGNITVTSPADSAVPDGSAVSTVAVTQPASITPVPPTSPTTSIEPSPLSSPTAPPAAVAVRILDARFTCGMADFPWIEVTLVADAPIDVSARLRKDSTYYGQSEPVQLAAGIESTIGFQHDSPPELRGQLADIVVVAASYPDTPIAITEIQLGLAADISCG